MIVSSIVRDIVRDVARPIVATSAFDPADLFVNGEPGAWYDPSDLSTLFQDAAGTTPVTGTGQPVGLMLDKRLRLERGAEVAPNAIPEIAENVGGVSSTRWVNTGPSDWSTAMANDAVVCTRISTTISATSKWQRIFTTDIGRTYEVVITVRDIENTGGAWWVSPDASFGNRLNSQTQLIANGGDIRFQFVATVTSYAVLIGADTTIGATFTLRNLEIRELPGNHATLVNASLNDASGLRSIVFNGTASASTVTSVDFTATDKVTVWSGLRKLSNAAVGSVVELSSGPANNGVFALFAPNSASATDYSFASQGMTPGLAITPANYPATESNIVTGIGDISGDLALIRVDGQPVASVVLDQGSGPYGDYTMFLGARDSTDRFFTGNLYGLIVRGAESSDAEIVSSERFLAKKSGVTLP